MILRIYPEKAKPSYPAEASDAAMAELDTAKTDRSRGARPARSPARTTREAGSVSARPSEAIPLKEENLVGPTLELRMMRATGLVVIKRLLCALARPVSAGHPGRKLHRAPGGRDLNWRVN